MHVKKLLEATGQKPPKGLVLMVPDVHTRLGIIPVRTIQAGELNMGFQVYDNALHSTRYNSQCPRANQKLLGMK